MKRRIASVEGPDPIDVAIGARLRVQRLCAGISQAELAKALGITFQQIQRYERGTNRLSASMLVRAAAKLRTTVAALVGEADTPDSVLGQLAAPRATEMLAAYAQISDGDVRRSLLELAASLVAPGAAAEADGAAH